MITKEEIEQLIKHRIKADIKHFNGSLSERYSIAWHGYIASLYEFSFIEEENYARLFDLLPRVESPNPIAEIFEGRDNDDE
jgi:hypothetical protein